MSTIDIINRITTATPATIARVAAVLDGRDNMAKASDLSTITLTEAAKRLNCSRPTIYRMVKSGAIRTMRLNGVDRVLVASLFERATGQASKS